MISPSLRAKLRAGFGSALVAAAGCCGLLAPAAGAAGRGFELVNTSSGVFNPEFISSTSDGLAAYWWVQLGSGDPAPEDGGVPDAYIASRSGDGWHTKTVTLYASHAVNDVDQGIPFGSVGPSISGDGATFTTNVGIAPEDTNHLNYPPFGSGASDIYRADSTGTTLLSAAPGQPAGPMGLPFGAYVPTPDLQTVVFTTDDGLVAEDTDGVQDLYRRSATGFDLVSRNTDGSANNESVVSGLPGPLGALNLSWVDDGGSSLSSDGKTVAFVTAARLDPSDQDDALDLYVWRNGQVVLASDSSRTTAQCANDCQLNVFFAGMSPDGSEVFFETGEQLTDADIDSGTDVYAYDTVAHTLELATAGLDASPAQASIISRNGDLFFVSAERLGSDPPAGSDPVLYRWDGASIRTVASLSPADQLGQSGATPNLIAAGQNIRPIRVAPDGGWAVFETAAPLVGQDSDTQTDVYQWSTTSGIRLISSGGDGAYPSTIGGPSSGTVFVSRSGRVTAANGAKVFFQSADALAPGAADNGKLKVYEWVDGAVSLVSAAGAANDAVYADNSASGDDVFFRTVDSLVGTDADDGQPDIYDARVGGGFPESPPSSVGVSSPGGGVGQVPSGPALASQTLEPLPAPAPNGSPAPTTHRPNGPVARRVRAPRLVRRALTAKARSVGVSLRVSVPGSARAELLEVGKTRRLARGRRVIRARSGKALVRLRMTKAGRRTLQDGRKHRVVLRVVFTPRGASTGVTRTYRVTVRVARVSPKRKVVG